MLTRACASWAPDAMGAGELGVVGLGGLPDMKPGHDIAALVLEAAERQGTPLEAGDVLIVTQKIVSKTEGGVGGLAGGGPGAGAGGRAGRELGVAILAVADELAAAAELVMGKLSGVPVAIVRGYEYPKGSGTARDMVRPPERDLFREGSAADGLGEVLPDRKS